MRRSLFVGIGHNPPHSWVYPAKKGSTKKNHIPIYDIVLMVLGAGAYFYFVINFKTIIGHATRISQLEVIVGIIGILVLAETWYRRVVGIPDPVCGDGLYRLRVLQRPGSRKSLPPGIKIHRL